MLCYGFAFCSFAFEGLAGEVRAAKIATVQHFLPWEVPHFSLADNAMN